jgi:hypothetical protein
MLRQAELGICWCPCTRSRLNASRLSFWLGLASRFAYLPSCAAWRCCWRSRPRWPARKAGECRYRKGRCRKRAGYRPAGSRRSRPRSCRSAKEPGTGPEASRAAGGGLPGASGRRRGTAAHQDHRDGDGQRAAPHPAKLRPHRGSPPLPDSPVLTAELTLPCAGMLHNRITCSRSSDTPGRSACASGRYCSSYG